MSQTAVAHYSLDDQTEVLIELESSTGYQPAGGAKPDVGKLKDACSSAVAGAQAVMEQVRAISPDEVELKFGIKVNGTMNWLIASAATESHFEVTLTWKSPR
jgi:hypothetical protein